MRQETRNVYEFHELPESAKQHAINTARDVMLPSLKLLGYEFKYFDGCFYPYLVKR